MTGSEPTAEPLECWAILELMGRRKLAGYVRDVTVAGAGFLRIDVPGAAPHDPPQATQFLRARRRLLSHAHDRGHRAILRARL